MWRAAILAGIGAWCHRKLFTAVASLVNIGTPDKTGAYLDDDRNEASGAPGRSSASIAGRTWPSASSAPVGDNAAAIE